MLWIRINQIAMVQINHLTKGESVGDPECANLTLADYMQDQIYKDESSELTGSKNQLGGSFKRVDSLAWMPLSNGTPRLVSRLSNLPSCGALVEKYVRWRSFIQRNQVPVQLRWMLWCLLPARNGGESMVISLYAWDRQVTRQVLL